MRFSLRAAAVEPTIPEPARGRRMASRLPVVRSGTALEVAELAWIAESVSREQALSIPAVLNCHKLIVGTVVQLGLFRYRQGERLEPGYLLTKPDPSAILSATISGTVDDLLFRGRAYWRVLDRDSEGFVTRARWTPVDDVTPETRSVGGSYSILIGYRVAGVDAVLDPADLIRFDGPFPGVLDSSGPALAAMLEVEAAARRLSGVELPAGVLENEGAELSEEEARVVVANFVAARRESGVGFLQGLKYSRADLNSGDLQLIEARGIIATDAARIFNVPVAMVAASPTGTASALLYANLSQQLAILIACGVGPYLGAIEQTISDVIPRGQSVAFDVQTFLRSDPQAAYEYATGLLGAGVIDQAEARALLGIPSSSTTGDLTPGRV